jgi:hypothetical protein
MFNDRDCDDRRDFFDLTLSSESGEVGDSYFIDSGTIVIRPRKSQQKLELCDYSEYEAYARYLELQKKKVLPKQG